MRSRLFRYLIAALLAFPWAISSHAWAQGTPPLQAGPIRLLARSSRAGVAAGAAPGRFSFRNPGPGLVVSRGSLGTAMRFGISFPTPKQAFSAPYGKFSGRAAQPTEWRSWSNHLPGGRSVARLIQRETKDHPKLVRFLKLFLPAR